MNNYEIKLCGGCYIEQPLEIGKDYTIGLTVNCYVTQMIDNNDGTFKEVFKTKPTGGMIITKTWDKTVKFKGESKNSPSVKMRNALYYKHADLGIEEDFQEWYDKIMSKIIANLDLILTK